MKRLLATLIVLSGLASCGNGSVVGRTEKFVDSFCEKCDSYSDEEIKESVARMDAFKKEFDRCRDNLSMDEQSRFIKASGAFQGALMKRTFNKAGKAVDDSADYVEGLINGITGD